MKWLKNSKFKYANEYTFKKKIDKDKFSKFSGLVKKYIMKKKFQIKKNFYTRWWEIIKLENKRTIIQ